MSPRASLPAPLFRGGEQRAQLGTGPGLNRLLAAAKDAGAARPFQRDGIAFDSKKRAFAKSDYTLFVLLEKLPDAFLLGLSHVGRPGVWIEIVGTDLKVDQVQGLERAWLHHRHVLGGLQRPACHDRARARSDVGHALGDSSAHRWDHPALLKALEEAKGVPTPDEDSVGALDRAQWVGNPVDRLERQAYRAHPGSHLVGIGLAIEHRERHEEDSLTRRKEVAHFRLDVVEKALAVLRGVADQQQPPQVRFAAPHPWILFASIPICLIQLR